MICHFSRKSQTGCRKNYCKIVAIVDRALEGKRVVQLVKQGVRLFEIRFDQFQGTLEQALSQGKQLKELAKVETIGTSHMQHSMHTIEKFTSVVDYLDIEFSSLTRDAMIQMVKEKQKRIILSAHDFSKPLSKRKISEIYKFAVKIGAQISKFACTVSNLSEYKDFLRSLRSVCSWRPVVTSHETSNLALNPTSPPNSNPYPQLAHMAMGRFGKASRILAPYFGSCLAYGYLFAPNASGQMSVQNLSRMHRLLYGTPRSSRSLRP